LGYRAKFSPPHSGGPFAPVRDRVRHEVAWLSIRLSGEILVVAQADGSLLKSTSLPLEWTRLSAKTGLPRIRFHDRRHTHATALLANNVNPKIASERLGHSEVGLHGICIRST
jgi:integrase